MCNAGATVIWDATKPASDDPAKQATDFDRFEDLTRRLVAVPKDEVDVKRNQEKAAKRPG